jgi:hypothetical protein
MIKLKRIKWTKNVARMKEMKMYTKFGEKLGAKRPLGRHRHR